MELETQHSDDASYVTADLKFCTRPTNGGSVHIRVDTQDVSSLNWVTQTVKIQDIRDTDLQFSCEENGFEFLSAPVTSANLEDDEDVERRYYREAEDMVVKLTGASQAHAVFHLRRSTDPADCNAFDKNSSDSKSPKYFGPARSMHCDYSRDGARVWMDHVPGRPDNWAELSTKRWALYSVWRPLAEVTRANLCMADSRTVEEGDLVEGTSSHVTATVEKKFGLWFLKYNPTQRYYYKSNMGTEDVLVLKLFDTRDEGRVTSALHSSFDCEKDTGLPRRSIELRCVVVWDD